MKRLRVYWRTELSDLRVLDSVPHLRLGPDEEEVITTNEGVDDIRLLAREYAGNFWMEDVQDVAASEAAKLVRQLAPPPIRQSCWNGLSSWCAPKTRARPTPWGRSSGTSSLRNASARRALHRC